jgi:hypothetical protein
VSCNVLVQNYSCACDNALMQTAAVYVAVH